MQLLRFRHSTNVDRIRLALAHKGLAVESVWVDPADRSPVERVSGQPLVPVLVDGERVIADSTAILEHLEREHPDPPLYPADPAAAAQVRLFADWFNRIWKAEPNRLAGEPDAPAAEREAWAAAMHARQAWFDALLTGRDHLFGAYSAADVMAWPFLRYAAFRDDDDTEEFHLVLTRELPLDGFANLAAWIDRVRTERWAVAERI